MVFINLAAQVYRKPSRNDGLSVSAMQEINPIKYKIADLRERTESLRGYL